MYYTVYIKAYKNSFERQNILINRLILVDYMYIYFIIFFFLLPIEYKVSHDDRSCAARTSPNSYYLCLIYYLSSTVIFLFPTMALFAKIQR